MTNPTSKASGISAIKAKVEDAASSAKAGTEKAKAATAVLLPCLACASLYAVPRVASALELSAVGVPLARCSDLHVEP
jgi:hypothetical protein